EFPALRVRLQQAEVDSVSRTGGLRQDAEAGDAVDVENSWLVHQNVVDLPHHGDSPLQRSRFRQFDVDYEVALVFVRQERLRQDLPDSSRQTNESTNNAHCQPNLRIKQGG